MVRQEYKYRTKTGAERLENDPVRMLRIALGIAVVMAFAFLIAMIGWRNAAVEAHAEAETVRASLKTVSASLATEYQRSEDLSTVVGAQKKTIEAAQRQIRSLEDSVGALIEKTEKLEKAAVTPSAAKKAKPKATVTTASATGWKTATASWYGPGFYGHTMAGGGTLTKTSVIVAHKTLPFGTRVEFRYNGKTCIAPVRDRGPFVAGRMWDLGPGLAAALGHFFTGPVEYRILP